MTKYDIIQRQVEYLDRANSVIINQMETHPLSVDERRLKNLRENATAAGKLASMLPDPPAPEGAPF